MQNRSRLVLSNTFNTRDLGGYVSHDFKYMTKYGIYYRSDRLDRLNKKDIEKLKEQNITTVIDLRSFYEVNKSPDTEILNSEIDYIHYPFMDELGFEKALKQEYEQTEILYQNLIDRLDRVGYLIEVLAEKDGAVLFHCTGGQDRTGVLAMLLLMIANVSKEDIIANYCVTSTYLIEDEDLFANINFKVDKNTFVTDPHNIESAYDYICDRYKGIDQYLSACGVEKKTIETIRNKFLTEFDATNDCVRIPLYHANNVRDLGGYTNQDDKVARYHRYVRADDMSALNQEELNVLYKYGVRNILDLRFKMETETNPDAFLKDERFHYVNIPLGSEYNAVTGDVTKITENIEVRDFLPKFYCSLALDMNTMKKILEVISEFKGGVLFHCSAGKDRTGVLSMIIYLLAKVRLADIKANYQVSYEYLKDKIKVEDKMEGMEVLLHSDARNIEIVYNAIIEKYKTVDKYIEALQLSGEQLNNILAGFI